MNQMSILFKMIEGQQINKYCLEKLLGVGDLGATFKVSEVVRDETLRKLAIKIIPERSDANFTELLTAINLEHPNIICSYRSDECKFFNSDAMLYLTMELGKESLQNRLTKRRLPPEEIKKIVGDIASALVYLHEEKKVHRNLKPENILLVEQNWKLSDFGLMRELNNENFLQTNNPIGTVSYKPPEAFNKDSVITAEWDIWSLGVILLEMLSGKIPYNTADSFAQFLTDVFKGRIKLPPFPKEFEPLVFGCLKKDSSQRWTAKQVLEAVTGRKTPSLPKTYSAPSQISLGSNFTEILPDGVELEMIAIPGGSFLMGSIDNEYTKPQHPVNLTAFRMGKYPITQAQYQAVMDNNPSYFKEGDDYPVEQVNWDDAKEFCLRLSKMTGKTYRLPSEAEWEYAAKAGTNTYYSFGDEASDLQKVSWYQDISQTYPVGKKKAGNKWGLYDMLGNVWEWCEDDWHPNYNGAPNDGRAWIDNNNRSQSELRTMRGDSRNPYSRLCRGVWRNFVLPNRRHVNDGFRVVC